MEDESSKFLDCVNTNEATSTTSCSLINLTADELGDQVKSVMALDSKRVALVGPRYDGEGYTITLIDTVYDAVMASTRIKTVHAGTSNTAMARENAGHLMVCHAGKRIFFKHGSKVANVILSEKLPSRLAGFIGHKVDLDVVPTDKCPQFLEQQSTEDNSDLPKWEVISDKETDVACRLGEASQTLDLYRIVPEILAKGSLRDIQSVLDTYTDIPELLLLNMIELLVMKELNKIATMPDDEEKEDSHEKLQNSKEEKVQVKTKKNLEKVNEKERQSLLARAFNVSITETLMVQHLRQSRFELAKGMLAWIVEELKRTKQKRKVVVDVEQLFLWLGLILNAHYLNFILSKNDEEVRNLILLASEELGQAKTTMDILASTLPLTKIIRNAAKTKASSDAVVGLMQSSSLVGNMGNMANRAYSIELVEL